MTAGRHLKLFAFKIRLSDFMRFKPLKILSLVLALLSFAPAITAYTPQYADETHSVRLRWKGNVIPVSISSSFLKQNLNIKTDSDVEGALRRSLEAWEKVADIKFQETSTEKQTISPAGKSGDGISLITIAQTPENLLLFAGDAHEIAARTRIFFNRRGVITEADIVLNPYAQFSTDGTIGTFDLEATLTHEIGHLLGLEHSTVVASTMFASQSKNGVYSLPNFGSRTLAEDDITGIRSLYGCDPETDCGGGISGKFTTPTKKGFESFQVVAEDAESGRTIASVSVDAEGNFKFEGLKAGSYRLFAKSPLKKAVSVEELGKVEVEKDKTSVLNHKLEFKQMNFGVQFIGFNGQISENAVTLNAGNSYQIYIAGKNLDPRRIEIGFNSPHLFATPTSLNKHDYGDEISVVSFEVNVGNEIPNGEYSFFVKTPDGARNFIVGGLTIETFENPWFSRSVYLN